MKIRKCQDIFESAVGEELLILNKSSKQYFLFNKSAKIIWDYISSEFVESAQLEATLIKLHPNSSAEEIKNDVQFCLKRLLEINCITDIQ